MEAEPQAAMPLCTGNMQLLYSQLHLCAGGLALPQATEQGIAV